MYVQGTYGLLYSVVYNNVDDLFMTSDSKDVLTTIAEALKLKYGAVTSHTGLQHDFLGINWDFSISGEVSLSMKGYLKDIMRKYNVIKKSKTPASDKLFTTDTNSPLLSNMKRQEFHSTVMTLHYLAKRIRPDILTAVCFCATRVLSPSVEDQLKLERILNYLCYTIDKVFMLRIGEDYTINTYVDSSFGLYPDGKSVTGLIIMLGQAPIFVKSSKQKIVTRSSTEAELVGISDSLSQILWTREYLMRHGLSLGPAIVYQDNQSTICLANKGRSTNERTRHIKVRNFFVAHYIEEKEIEIKYLPTGKMIADFLTKPLHGTMFRYMAGLLLGRPGEYTDNRQLHTL